MQRVHCSVTYSFFRDLIVAITVLGVPYASRLGWGFSMCALNIERDVCALKGCEVRSHVKRLWFDPRTHPYFADCRDSSINHCVTLSMSVEA